MYRCEITGRFSRLGEKLHRVVVETRPMTYYKYVKNEETKIWERVVAGMGFETVKELSCSLAGKELWDSWSNEERALFLKKAS